MAILYENYITGDDASSGIFGGNWESMSFTVSAGQAHGISHVKLLLHRVGSPGTVTVSIRATAVETDDSPVPTGADLVSATTDGDSLPTDTSGEWRQITFATSIELSAGVEYAIVIRATTGDTNNRILWHLDITSPTYAGGVRGTSDNSGGHFHPWDGTSSPHGPVLGNYDSMFEEWGLEAFPAGGAGVEVDWNNDGDFDDSEDEITTDVQQLKFVHGREAELEATPAGTMELTVDDPDGDYSPTNASTRFGNGNVTVGRPIRVKVLHLGTTYNLWRGFIERFRVDPRPEIKKAYLFCVDGKDQLQRDKINAPSGGPLTNVFAGETPGPIKEILDAASWPAADRTLDTGADQFSEWWAHRKAALEALDEIETGEKSFIYIDGEGKLTYEDRHHRLKDGQGGASDHRTSQATFNDTMTALPQDFSARTVRNIALVTGHKRVAKASAYVFGMLDTPTIDNGSSETFWVDLPNPASAITESEANVDWKANRQADGSGTDETANVSIVTTFFGQSVRMVVTNSAGIRIYLIPGTSDANETLRIRATEYDDTELVAESSDATSKTKHGDRSIEVEMQYVGNVNTLKAYADWLKDRFKDPHQDNLVMELVNSSDALLTQIFARKLSDRITLTAAHLGISGVDFFIEKKEIEYSEGGKVIKGRFTLAEDLEPANPWLLGDAGFSELGDTTFLGF